MDRGFVSLVGAGPGHPDFLTLKGLRALQSGQIIFHDALLHPSFRDHFPDGAEIVDVGKRCGAHNRSQEQINALLVEAAKAGKRVVRLKGGDPFLFGRGSEEALALGAEGIPFEIIPGVSALAGVTGAAGIPLTHRGLAREVHVFEGHGVLAAPPDWEALARFRGTIVVFMATRVVADIARSLIAHGAPPDTPAALVENGSTPEQVTTISSLGNAVEGGLCAQTSGPGLLVIGPTVALHHALVGRPPSQPQSQPQPQPQPSPQPFRSLPYVMPHSPAAALADFPEPRRQTHPFGGRGIRRVGEG